MEREYNVGTWLTPSDEYIKDIKQTLVEKGVATELTPTEELSEVVKNISPLKSFFDVSKSMENFFKCRSAMNGSEANTYHFKNITNEDDYLNTLIAYNDTENVENMALLFNYCSNIVKVPRFNTSNVIEMSQAFQNCKKLTEIPEMDTRKVQRFNNTFDACKSLVTVHKLDLQSAISLNGMFNYCEKLTNLYLYNIGTYLQIGSSSSVSPYGNLLSIESLIHTCKECIKQSSNITLTVGTTNLAKLANVYVRFVDRNQTTIAVGEKGEVEVCEADNNDAMTITEYMTLKSWTLA